MGIMGTIMSTDASDNRSPTLPPRSGGEGRRASRERCEPGWGDLAGKNSPPTPDPSPPLATLAGGGEKGLYRLMVWLSPAYPVGAFSYSSGIEWAVEAGDIKDAATLQNWLTVMLRGLGARLVPMEAPFDPEQGAYGGHAGGHTHDHEHGHDHHHEHGHDHQDHADERSHEPDRDHG